MKKNEITYIHPKGARGGRANRFILKREFYHPRKNTREILKILLVLVAMVALLVGFDMVR